MKTSHINFAAVAAVAEAMEQQGQEPSVRAVHQQLGGSYSTVTPLLRKWKEVRSASVASNIQLNPIIIQLIKAQIDEAASQASNDANIRARDAGEAFDLLTLELAQSEARLVEMDADLSEARRQTLLQQGQLQERARELEEMRNSCAAKIAEIERRALASISEADQRAASERVLAETLRQDLVRASIQSARVPDLEVAINEAQRQLKSAVNDVADARQLAAVANERAEAQFDIACNAVLREAKLEAQLQRTQEQQENSVATERALQREILRLSTLASAFEARCVLQLSELEQMRQGTRKPDYVENAALATPHSEPHCAATA